ncbi:hypothetical protein SAMN04488168_13649 [Bacillus sp. 491mf]|uniref:hypothetical protein n=1 Tax=Bacillus sp. 491mf TaxID=1761755 RepID=UPI0008E9F640|nr:hypothetical protein [Bacillus sp. 491mf]SFD39147.1 hypothetical protein SAMN04488168_13649 [Bacillus sp. 491mf]
MKKCISLAEKMAEGMDNAFAFFKGVEPARDGTLIGKQGGPGKINEWVNTHHAESSKFMNDKIQGLEASLAKRMGDRRVIERLEPRGNPLDYEIVFNQDRIALETYERLRLTGLDMKEIETFTKNTGLSVEEATALK